MSTTYYEILWHKDKIQKLLKENQIVIIVGECGGGKTTQIPQIVLNTFDKGKKTLVACIQPNTLAVVSVAWRVAKELNVTLGKTVGYHTKIEDKTSSETTLMFLTNGMLLREAMTDPLLGRYKVIIIDEAHERTMSRDILFVLLKEVVQKRPDLKLVVISTTLESLQDFFGDAPSLKVLRGFYHVDVSYTKPEKDYVNAAIKTAVQKHVCEPPGDILVFLSGWEEVEAACQKIREEIANRGDEVGPVVVVPLHSCLSPTSLWRTLKATAPSPLKEGGPAGRKIVVATNIAEASSTISGIVYVIDTGFTELKVYNSTLRVESLSVTSISKASAHRRGVCAGRTRTGKCFRLYTKRSFNQFQPQTTPEISRSNFVKTVLTLKKLGIDNLEHFCFIVSQPQPALSQALDILTYLGALDKDGNLTRLGNIMSEFPLDPHLAKMLVESPKFKCSNEILSISAMLSVPNCFVRPLAAQPKAKFRHIDGDHLTLLNVYEAFKLNGEKNWCDENYIDFMSMQSAEKMRGRLLNIMSKFGIECLSGDLGSDDYYINIKKAIIAGFEAAHVAYLEKAGHYVTAKEKHVVQLHPSTALSCKPELVVYHALTDNKLIQTVTAIRRSWLKKSTVAVNLSEI